MPPATMQIIGLSLNPRDTTRATPNRIQLFQSGKFSGVMNRIAAAPIRPTTVGRRSDMTPVNIALPLNFVYSLQRDRTMMNDGRTTATVAVNEPRTHKMSDAPVLASA